jgi:hypothetical protein
MYLVGGMDEFKNLYIIEWIFLILLNYYTVSVGNVTLSGGGRYGYAAVLLNDNERIVYIGGRLASGEYLKMSDIYIYNVKVNQWYYQQSHSAIISK